MFTLSAFADEIDPDPVKQMDVLSHCGVKHIELRSILKTNVLDLTDLQVRELKSLLDQRFFCCSWGFDGSSPELRFGLESNTVCDPRNGGLRGH